MTPHFLTVEDVLKIHARGIDAYGGPSGIKDMGALESAVMAPQNHFFYTGGDLFDLAGVLLWHLVRDHGFIDGNKRVALGSALVFLRVNGVSFKQDDDFFEHLTLQAADGTYDKNMVADLLRLQSTH